MGEGAPKLDLGFMVTGVVQYDPSLKRYVLIVEDQKGFDPQEAFKKYEGKEVRFTLASMETIATLSALVQNGDLQLDLSRKSKGGPV